ncbi:WRKY transcription factor [Musa troglodytarum]|uniref:WRKY transcription factor n=1 Tax=Musa troglodytarum TaxID=320322 RepID=A0A9E7ETU7_9LILI|nr:WRKY transcription factor [Musa troglodytarum]
MLSCCGEGEGRPIKSLVEMEMQMQMQMEMAAPRCTSPGCNHGTVIEEISRAHELTSQLRAFLLPLLPSSSLSELAVDHLTEMIECYNSALSMLRAAGGCRSTPSDASGYCADDQKRKRLEGSEWPVVPKKRRNENCRPIVTSVLYDGYQWRKYGQKVIHGATHPKSYFRCTYSKDQGCPATKTVQRDESDADPPKYIVVYRMAHTCRTNMDANLPYALESSATDTTSVVVRHQHFCPPSAATPNPSQSSYLSDGDQELMHLVFPQEVPGTGLDTEGETLSLPWTWESLELDAYLKTMMDSMY